MIFFIQGVSDMLGQTSRASSSQQNKEKYPINICPEMSFNLGLSER
jgi:hypothetical protein